MRLAICLILAAWVGWAHGQERGVSQDWLDNLQEERTTIVALLSAPDILFVNVPLDVPMPVSAEVLETALVLIEFDPKSTIDSATAMRRFLQFDRGYRQSLQARLAEIDQALQAAGMPVPPSPAPATPATPAAPTAPVGGSLFGGDATSRGLAFDEYIEQTQRATTPHASESGALEVSADGTALLGRPICTYTVELIITSGTERIDRDPNSPSHGQSVLQVPAPAENGFHVQLYHPATGTVRLSGRDARIALEQKGYLVATGDGWRSTPAYEDFVNYGAGYQRGANACTASSPVRLAGMPSATARGTVARAGNGFANVDIKWTIDNPTGKPIRFTRMMRTHWVMRQDGMGRFAGGEWQTDSQRGFTLPAGRSERPSNTWLPSSGRGNASGTYREVYEGTDAEGNPIVLELEFNGADANWP